MRRRRRRRRMVFSRIKFAYVSDGDGDGGKSLCKQQKKMCALCSILCAKGAFLLFC